MSIVTKKGDKGQTSLYGGERVPKSAARVEAYGEVDELSAFLGFARALGPGAAVEARLLRLQTELLTVGAVLAAGKNAATKVGPVLPAWAVHMEEEVKAHEKVLPPLRRFVLAGEGGGALQLGAALHMARTVARRAERRVVALSREEAVPEEVLVYFNRLSDLLFVMARAASEACEEIPLAPPGSLA